MRSKVKDQRPRPKNKGKKRVRKKRDKVRMVSNNAFNQMKRDLNDLHFLLAGHVNSNGGSIEVKDESIRELKEPWFLQIDRDPEKEVTSIFLTDSVE
jgi:hypothetical protein